ncbi:unnamed protein product [Linum tenue]|uniref:GHMP kinase C-terminal domain-containing protein n=1 Tax=Linum tenue TaxID=586396 RepID=A0AAV0NJV5_9ROSI|nr:unnamed protein product [Linum tenue]
MEKSEEYRKKLLPLSSSNPSVRDGEMTAYFLASTPLLKELWGEKVGFAAEISGAGSSRVGYLAFWQAESCRKDGRIWLGLKLLGRRISFPRRCWRLGVGGVRKKKESLAEGED